MSMEMAGKSSPRVSVIIPLYNHEQYISETVDSVLRQTFQDFELIIINDGSTDKSEEIVKNITDVRIRYYSQQNQGAPFTINKGAQLARGEYISILNSDDLYDPERLKECMQVLEAEASLSAAFSHIAFIDEKGEFIKYVRGPEDIWTDYDPETRLEENIVLDLLAGNFLVSTSNLFCRKKVFDAIGGFVNLKYAHDYEFFLRLCYHHKTCLIEKPLLKYRIHPSNTIRKNEAEVSFEVGLTLTDFFLRNDIGKYLSGDIREGTLLAKLFDSLNTYKSEKMIMILLSQGMRSGDRGSSFLSMLADDPDNPFRKKYLDWFNADMEDTRRAQEGWKQAHEAWQKWEDKDKEAQAGWKEAHEAWQKCKEKDEEVQAVWKEAHEAWQKWKEKDEEAQAGWKEAHEAWQKWKETNERLIEMEQQLAATNRQLLQAEEKIEEMNSLLNSTSFRLGRALTWPLRKVRDMAKYARK